MGTLIAKNCRCYFEFDMCLMMRWMEMLRLIPFGRQLGLIITPYNAIGDNYGPIWLIPSRSGLLCRSEFQPAAANIQYLQTLKRMNIKGDKMFVQVLLFILLVIYIYCHTFSLLRRLSYMSWDCNREKNDNLTPRMKFLTIVKQQ